MGEREEKPYEPRLTPYELGLAHAVMGVRSNPFDPEDPDFEEYETGAIDASYVKRLPPEVERYIRRNGRVSNHFTYGKHRSSKNHNGAA